jgi:hypothetical protein
MDAHCLHCQRGEHVLGEDDEDVMRMMLVRGSGDAV